MTKTFSDSEFRLYGAVQSFFYRCWAMFGAGREVEHQRRVNQEMVRTWASRIFPNESGTYGVHYCNVTFSGEGGYIIDLVIQHSRVINPVNFTVDIRDNLEDYDFYNIKWVYDENCSVENKSNYTYKKVPKVF